MSGKTVKSSKAREIQEYFLNSIRNGKWKAGDKLPTEKEVREQFGVGNSSVREAITTLVNDGLIERRQGSGTYVSNERINSNTIVITANLNIISRNHSPYYLALLNELQRLICSCGYNVIIRADEPWGTESREGCQQFVDSLVSKETRGVLSVISLGESGELLSLKGIPCISVIHHEPASGSGIVLDFSDLIKTGIGEFFDAGIEKIAVFYIELRNEMQCRRDRGKILKCFRDMNLSLAEERLIGISLENTESAYGKFKELWNGPFRPDGVFFLDDVICDISLRAISELQINVPSELAIVTESYMGGKFSFPVDLARIVFNPLEIAREGWEMLRAMIEEDSSEKSIRYIKPELVKGESVLSGCVAEYNTR